MIDQETKERLVIRTDEQAGPYLMVPLNQLPQVRDLLQRHRIANWVDDDAIQLDGKAVIAIVNFGRGAESPYLQQLLDEID